MDHESHIHALLAEGVWRSTPYRLRGFELCVWRRRCALHAEAKQLRDKYLSQVYRSGGALFIAYTAPIKAYTPEESVTAAVAGERAPWYVELFLVERIAFDRLLCFLDVLEFGTARGAGSEESCARRVAAAATLTRISQIVRCGLTSIATSLLHGRLLAMPTPGQRAEISHLALQYSKNYWRVETPEQYLIEEWKEGREFQLGAQ